MKKFIILMLSIWAFGFILLPQSAEAEMDSLTDEEMEEARVNNSNLPLTLKVGIDLESESDDLLTDAEELKLKTHFLESPTPYNEERLETFKYIKSTDHTTLEMEAQFKPGPIRVEK